MEVYFFTQRELNIMIGFILLAANKYTEKRKLVATLPASQEFASPNFTLPCKPFSLLLKQKINM